MDYKNIIVEIGDDYVAEITLNRPDNLNTFNIPLAVELSQALRELDLETQVRVIIIKGAGRAFCAGIDVSDFSGKSTMEYREWVECMENPLVTISRINKPVIAQVHGVAAANGAGLVAAADLAVAGEEARIGLTAINIGLNCIGPVIPVTRSIGRKRALELLFYGDLVTAREALNMGLVNRVIPESDLDRETRSWAAILTQKSPVALQIAKKAFYAAADLDYYKAFEYMNEAFARLCSTEDAREGVSAFMEKRNPVWKQK
jgi:enoyl-CoA hydratase/carnithine racemase